LLTICLENGFLINLSVERQFQGFVQDSEDITQAKSWVSDTKEVKLDQKQFQSDHTLMMSFNIIQTEADTPLLDVRSMPNVDTVE
jgi:hypothetical protein